MGFEAQVQFLNLSFVVVLHRNIGGEWTVEDVEKKKR